MTTSDVSNPPARLKDAAVALTLGTDRAPGTHHPRVMLTAAAVAGARSRAGFEPTSSPTPIDPCPPETRPPCPPAADARLAGMMLKPDAALLEEWAILAEQAGVRAPNDLAATVLAWWMVQNHRPDVVFRCLGQRGIWLASLHPVWATRVPGMERLDQPETTWETGSRTERIGMLTALRQTNPGQALDLVRSTWASDPAADRSAFVEVLRTGLGANDETFLESALDDRSKTVRSNAAALLADLPGSALQARAAVLLAGVVSTDTKRGLRKKTIRVTLTPPAAFDPAWVRDGMDAKPPAGIGERAWWLRQIIELAPLDAWVGITGLDPQGVLDALRADDYVDDADAALLSRLTRRSDPTWAGPVARVEFARPSVRLHALIPLWSTLPPTQAEVVLGHLLADGVVPANLMLAVLAGAGWAWSAGFSTTAVNTVAEYVKPGQVADYHPLSWLEDIATRLHVHAVDPFEQLIRTMYPQPTPKAFQILGRARFRAEMHQEFQQ